MKLLLVVSYLFRILLIPSVIAKLSKNHKNVYDIELSVLSNAVLETSDQSANQDFSASYVKTSEADVKVYRPKIFSNIRKKLSVDDRHYVNNLLPQRLICIANSDSKSGQRFWISNDGLVVIKTIKHYEAKNLKRIIDDYHEHVMNNDHCTIASVFGLYRVKLKGHIFSKYYLVARNVFPLLGEKDMFIYKKYDLKGSLLGRSASSKSNVEKDIDILRSGRSMFLGDVKPYFMSTLENDVHFLKRHSFMDYSMLISIERSPVKHQRRFPLSQRGKLSRYGSSTPEDSGKLLILGSDGNTYHFGIIDFLQKYTFRKWLETLFKSIFHKFSEISCVPPDYYAKRMVNFFNKIIV